VDLKRRLEPTRNKREMPVKFAYTIIYVDNVKETLDFYQQAFHLNIHFLHESGAYGELDTGVTKLAFADNDMATQNGIDIKPNQLSDKAPGIEIALVAEDVAKSYALAIENGALAIKAPEVKPWGQTVAYVKDLNGVLVELCSQMG